MPRAKGIHVTTACRLPGRLKRPTETPPPDSRDSIRIQGGTLKKYVGIILGLWFRIGVMENQMEHYTDMK